MCLLAGTRRCFPRREVALIDYRFPKVWPFWPKISPDSPKVMRETLQLRDCEAGSTVGMESGMEMYGVGTAIAKSTNGTPT